MVAASITQMSARMGRVPQSPDKLIMTPGHARPRRHKRPARMKLAPHMQQHPPAEPL